MPTAPAKACTTPRCPKRAEPNEWGLVKCADHAVETAKHYKKRENRTPEQKAANKRMYGPGWKRTSEAFRKRYPWCEKCGAPATEVDHIVPLRQGGSASDWANLQSLC